MKNIRQKLGVTQRELAEMLGVSQNYVAQIESGRKSVSKKMQLSLEKLSADDVADSFVDWRQRALIAEAKLESLKSQIMDLIVSH